MNNPRVKLLKYHLVTAENFSYSNPPPRKYSHAEFHAELKDGVLTIHPTKDYPTAVDAAQVVKPFIDAWEIAVGLDHGLGKIGFTFASAELEDLAPAGTANSISSTVSLTISGAAAADHAWPEYPAPPASFAVNALVWAMWARYKAFKEGKELLLNMGYFCLSIIQADAGGRGRASSKYRIARDVLDELGTLTSEKGDFLTARKIDANSTHTPLTQPEEAWVEAAVKMLIKRVAEHPLGAPPAVKEITMADLPAK